MIEFIKNKWNNLSAKKKIFAVAVVAIIIASVIFS